MREGQGKVRIVLHTTGAEVNAVSGHLSSLGEAVHYCPALMAATPKMGSQFTGGCAKWNNKQRVMKENIVSAR